MMNFEQRVEECLKEQAARLLKIETNHLAHIEPDVRYLKEVSVRMERSLAEILEELKKNSNDTHQLRLALVEHVGESKNATQKVQGEVDALKSAGSANNDWVKGLIMAIVGLLFGVVGYAIVSKLSG